jgi:uncharacterized membrane protein YbhN (UPF0104 family)
MHSNENKFRMSSGRIGAIGISLSLGAVLVYVLVKIDGFNLHVLVAQLARVDLTSFAELLGLTTLHIYLSNLKWRSVDAELRHYTDSKPSGVASFAFTSVGVALGQILPQQLSVAGARTVGTYVHGRALKRGAAGTLFEQSFDVVIVAFLAIASVVTRLFRGGRLMWTSSAVGMIAIALLVAGPGMSLIRRILASSGAGSRIPRNRILRRISELQHSGFLNSRLARRLVLLSAARFVVQVLMLGLCARAIDVQIPLWQLAAALPFAIMGAAIAMTPGGIGITELSFATVLTLFGTSLRNGAQWAVASRVLVTTACVVIAIGAAVLLALSRDTTPGNPRRNPARPDVRVGTP